MAPVGERADRDSGSGPQNGEEEGHNLWASILSEVQSSSATKLPATKSLLVLGENESGKTTLIAKLQGNEDPKKGSGLEYLYINVKDEYRDDQTRLGTWLVDGDLHHRGLVKFALNEDNFEHTLVLLVASMSAPWNIMESLQRWTEVLSTHVDRLKLPRGKLQEYRESLVRHFQEYTEPEEGASGSSMPRRTEANPLHPAPHKGEEDKVLLPLGENTLAHNLGIPIVVVLTKSDAISTLEKENEYREEHFDFIQQHIRKFCLKYGAALFYTSVKEGKNCDLLYKYIVHRIYGFPFAAPAHVVERDSVFIPSGWDNEKKISILYENMSGMNPDDTYEDIIARPITRKLVQRDAEISAEDEQLFLMKLQTQLAKNPPASGTQNREPPLRPSSGVQKPTSSPRGGGTQPAGGIGPSPKKMEAGKQGGPGGNENVLANFFNSLLTKKSAGDATGASPKASDRSAVSRDAAAELDRMNRAKKTTTTSALNNQTSHNS